ncbi:bacterial membrane protein YfhO domain protein [Streptococcus infantis SK970]|nr:bacterial membrane protein YfhO domain protein [Streptococcus infantis SK970]
MFATAYALSGMLVSYQMNVIFYDAMIMLPLVIVYLEQLLDGEAPYPYAFVLGLTVLLQFYMGYMISIFVILYACYYVSPRLAIEGGWKQKLKHYFQPLWKFLIYSILGVAMASIILIPVFFNLLESKGQVANAMTFSFAFQINPLDILSKLSIGGFDNASGWSAGPNLPNIYIGALGFIGFIMFFTSKKMLKERKIAAGVVTLIFFTSFVNEFVSKIWHMGQNPAGFFFRFSWIFSFFMLILAYQVLKEKIEISRQGKLLSVAVLALSAIYLYTKDFTYLPKTQPEVLTKFISNHFVIFIVLLITGIVAGSYLYWDRSFKTTREKKMILLTATGIIIVLVGLLQTGYLFSRVILTLIIYLAVLALLRPRISRLSVLLLSALTIFELGYNAYLSQVTLGYADVDKFVDATVSVKRVTDSVQENADQPFYRIARTFSYSRTTPSLIGYPGLSTFSSSLERTTMDQFAYMGDQGINAATEYENGTPLTDALYGIRYYMDIKDIDQKEKMLILKECILAVLRVDLICTVILLRRYMKTKGMLCMKIQILSR